MAGERAVLDERWLGRLGPALRLTRSLRLVQRRAPPVASTRPRRTSVPQQRVTTRRSFIGEHLQQVRGRGKTRPTATSGGDTRGRRGLVAKTFGRSPMVVFDVDSLRTADPEWAGARELLVQRNEKAIRDAWSRVRPLVAPGHPISATEDCAIRYALLVIDHAVGISRLVRGQVYAPALALVRILIEALYKMLRLAGTQLLGSGVEDVISSQPRVNKRLFREMDRYGIPGMASLWNDLAPWVNNFTHGGLSHINSRAVGDRLGQHYEAQWVFTAMQLAFISLDASEVVLTSLLGSQDVSAALHRSFQLPLTYACGVQNGQPAVVLSRSQQGIPGRSPAPIVVVAHAVTVEDAVQELRELRGAPE